MFGKIVDYVCLAIITFIVPIVMILLVLTHFRLTGSPAWIVGAVIFWAIFLSVWRTYEVGKETC